MRVEDRPDQLRLGEPAPYVKSSDTSMAAAKAIRDAQGELCQRVLQSLKDQGPATDQELQARLSMNPDTERPRRIALKTAGLIRECGKRKTSSGRSATVWEAV